MDDPWSLTRSTIPLSILSVLGENSLNCKTTHLYFSFLTEFFLSPKRGSLSIPVGEICLRGPSENSSTVTPTLNLLLFLGQCSSRSPPSQVHLPFMFLGSSLTGTTHSGRTDLTSLPPLAPPSSLPGPSTLGPVHPRTSGPTSSAESTILVILRCPP